MLVFDCFSLFNELDILEIRLHELSKVVDYFVLVEATRTHVGNPKRLYYLDNLGRFSQFKNQIIHVVVDNMPISPDEIANERGSHWLESDYQKSDDWVRERFQRNAIMQGLTYANPEDMIIIGDADEIVRASVVEDLKTTIVDGSNAINQSLCSGYVNWQCTNMPWWGSKVLRKKFITTPSEDRFHTPAARGVESGGWHFMFMGGADAVRLKIRSYAHSEFNVPSLLMKVDERLTSPQDVLGRDYMYKVVPIDDTYPKYLVDNQDKFSHLIYKANA
jgi:beta-1,4-mannosyl-glycoprotein beta-1,4-N-acetylglucosaminyltransferase